MMKTKFLFLSTGVLSLLLMLTMVSCNSPDYNTEQAVNRARTYLLEHTPELSQLQHSYIRYNQPVLLHTPLTTSNHRSQICITWLIPGVKEAYMVYGVDNYEMREWYPVRLIKKRYINNDKLKEAAIAAARSYVMNSMLFLSTKERNWIRFSVPKFAITKFPLDTSGVIQPLDAAGKPKRPKDLAAERKSLASKIQVSVIYTIPDAGRKVVVVGLSSTGLSGWKPVTGLVADLQELKSATITNLPD